MSDLYNPAQAGFNDGADFLLNSGYLLGGTHDPSSIATYGAKGAIWVQVAQYGIGTVGIFQKQDDGKSTNWTPIGGGGGSNAYNPAVPSDWKLPLPTTTQQGLDQAAEFINFQSEYFIYADAVSGSDVDGDGSILRPFQTIQAAIAAYAAAVGVGNYCIKLNPGDYGGAPVAIPSQLNKNLSIEGTGSAVNISAVLSFTSAGLSDEFLLMSNVSVQNPFDIDLSASPNCLVFLNNGSYIVNRIDTLPSGPQFVRVSNSVVQYFQTNSTLQFVNCLFVGGPPSVVGATGNAFFQNTIFSFMVATVDGNIAFYSSVTGGSVLSGTGVLTGDATSLNPLVSTLPGLNYLDKAPDIGYTPATPANWIVTPAQVQAALDELASRIAGLSVSFENVRYVSKNGNDATGNGSINKPYLTVQAAMTSIVDATNLKRYVIMVQPGRYTETNLKLKANVFVVGLGDYFYPTRIQNNVAIDLDPNFNVANDIRSGFDNINLASAVNLNFNAVSSNEGKVYFRNCQFASTLTMTAFSNINQVSLENCRTFGLISQNGVNAEYQDNYLIGGLTLSSLAGLNTLARAFGNALASNINHIGNGVDPITAVYGGNSYEGGTFSASGNLVTVTADVTSLPAAQTISGGAVLNKSSVAQNIGFTPAVPANFPVGTDDVKKALDYLGGTVVTPYNEEVVYHTITAPEAAVKEIILAVPTLDLAKVILLPIGGVPQDNVVDFVMLDDVTLSWAGLGLDGVLAAGDVLLITYPS